MIVDIADPTGRVNGRAKGDEELDVPDLLCSDSVESLAMSKQGGGMRPRRGEAQPTAYRRDRILMA